MWETFQQGKMKFMPFMLHVLRLSLKFRYIIESPLLFFIEMYDDTLLKVPQIIYYSKNWIQKQMEAGS